MTQERMSDAERLAALRAEAARVSGFPDYSDYLGDLLMVDSVEEQRYRKAGKGLERVIVVETLLDPTDLASCNAERSIDGGTQAGIEYIRQVVKSRHSFEPDQYQTAFVWPGRKLIGIRNKTKGGGVATLYMRLKPARRR